MNAVRRYDKAVERERKKPIVQQIVKEEKMKWTKGVITAIRAHPGHAKVKKLSTQNVKLKGDIVRLKDARDGFQTAAEKNIYKLTLANKVIKDQRDEVDAAKKKFQRLEQKSETAILFKTRVCAKLPHLVPKLKKAAASAAKGPKDNWPQS